MKKLSTIKERKVPSAGAELMVLVKRNSRVKTVNPELIPEFNRSKDRELLVFYKGAVHPVANLSHFCREHNLRTANVLSAFSNKGWIRTKGEMLILVGCRIGGSDYIINMDGCRTKDVMSYTPTNVVSFSNGRKTKVSAR